MLRGLADRTTQRQNYGVGATTRVVHAAIHAPCAPEQAATAAGTPSPSVKVPAVVPAEAQHATYPETDALSSLHVLTTVACTYLHYTLSSTGPR